MRPLIRSLRELVREHALLLALLAVAVAAGLALEVALGWRGMLPALGYRPSFRYFLIREVPFDADGNFSWERFEERYNADLANALGNLASRTIAMVERYRGGVVPAAGHTSLDAGFAEDLGDYHAAFDADEGWLLHAGLQAIWRAVARGNEYVDRQAPWKLAKDPALAAQLDETLGALVRQLARFAVVLFPYMPGKAAKLWGQLGAGGDLAGQRFATLMELDAAGWQVTKGAPMFPKETAPTGGG